MTTPSQHIAFIGGGNMASAIIGGLIGQGQSADRIVVVEPFEAARDALRTNFGITAHADAAAAASALDGASIVVWAVKPQTFKDAAAAASPYTRHALHLSVAAGITTDSMASWLGTGRIVRAMPNTPALVGLGMTGLFARDDAGDEDRTLVEQVVRTTGELAWVPVEQDLDAVTALSGSGPAYVFYFLEAMRDAGENMGLSPELALQLATGTFIGAATLAQRSDDPPQILRERVTSKGGTTHAAVTTLQAAKVKESFEMALEAARRRAEELGREYGA